MEEKQTSVKALDVEAHPGQRESVCSSSRPNQAARDSVFSVLARSDDYRASESSLEITKEILASVEDSTLMEIYEQCLKEDPEMKQRAFEWYHKDEDDLIKSRQIDSGGLVPRRTALPFLTNNTEKKQIKKKDPALRNNPLQGRLVTLIGTSMALFLVFLQRYIIPLNV